MKRFIVAAVALLVVSEAAPARAQFGAGHGHHFGRANFGYTRFGYSPFGYAPFGYPGFGYGGYSYSYRTGFGFAVGGPHFRLGFSGGFVARSVFLPPAVVGPLGYSPVFAFNPFGFGFGNPFFGAAGPAVVAVPVPVPVVIDGDDPAGADMPPRGAGGLFPKDDFIVIAPRKEVPDAGKVARVEKKVPRPPGPVIPFDPFKPPAKAAAEVPEADPKKEAARLVKLGRDSFAAGDYGRAAEHFGRAAGADPADATAHFLRAQAKFAAGKFAAAVADIRAGLALHPKWPGSAFAPAALYGEHPEKFVLHLLALKKAAGEDPGEATLEFLLGYELWFGGDKPEARKHFAAAEKLLPAPGPIALFK
jgi:hypothetical protein